MLLLPILATLGSRIDSAKQTYLYKQLVWPHSCWSFSFRVVAPTNLDEAKRIVAKARKNNLFFASIFKTWNLFTKIVLSSSTCCCSRSRRCTSATTSLTTWQMFKATSTSSALKVCLGGAIVQLTWSADERAAKILFAFFFQSFFFGQIYRHH